MLDPVMRPTMGFGSCRGRGRVAVRPAVRQHRLVCEADDGSRELQATMV